MRRGDRRPRTRTTIPAPAAAFVAMDPFSGRVLALGSLPTYNANDVRHADRARAATTRSGPATRSIDRATDGLYPTGSTFKPITALAGLARRRDHAADQAGRGRLLHGRLRHAGAAVLQLRPRRLRRPRPRRRARGLRGHLLLPDRRRAQRQRHATSRSRTRRAGSGSGSSPGHRPRRRRRRRHRARLQPTSTSYNRVIPRRGTATAARPSGAYAHDQLAINGLHAAALRAALDDRPEHPARHRPGLSSRRAAADGGRLLGDRQRRHGLVAADRDGRSSRPSGAARAAAAAAGRRATSPSTRPTSAARAWPGLHDAAQTPAGTSYAVFGNFPRTVYGKTGTARARQPGRPVLVRRLRARPQASDRDRGDDRAGRLRRGRGRAGRAADAVASGSACPRTFIPGIEPGPLMVDQRRSRSRSRGATRRRSRRACRGSGSTRC